MSTFACESEGIFRITANGTRTRLCPPIAVVGSEADPERPLGRLVHLCWATHADATWHEMKLPSSVVARAALLEGVLATTSWFPEDDAWHDFICSIAIDHLTDDGAAAFDDMALAAAG